MCCQGSWTELASNKVEERPELTLYVIIATGSLLFLAGIAFFVYKRCFRGKENTAKVISLDFDDADGTAEFLSTLEEEDGAEDGNDGVFLMVYLPAPYEKTLTKIARAASTSSSHNDVEIVQLHTDQEWGFIPSNVKRVLIHITYQHLTKSTWYYGSAVVHSIVREHSYHSVALLYIKHSSII